MKELSRKWPCGLAMLMLSIRSQMNSTAVAAAPHAIAQGTEIAQIRRALWSAARDPVVLGAHAAGVVLSVVCARNHRVGTAGRSVSRVCESDPAGALAAHDLSPRARLALAYGLGVGGYVAGLWLSVPLDLPSGPLAGCTLAFLALLSAPLSMLISGRARNGH